jgi:hypothetical protein
MFASVWKNSDYDLLKRLLEQEQYEEFNKHLEGIEPRRQDLILTGLSDDVPFDLVDAYYYATPKSRLADAFHICRYLYHAWEIRGSGFARETSEDALRQHAEIMARLAERGRDNWEHFPHPLSASNFLTLIMVLSRDGDLGKAVFDEIMHYFPGEAGLMSQALSQVFNPKWGLLDYEQWIAYCSEMFATYLPGNPAVIYAVCAVDLERSYIVDDDPYWDNFPLYIETFERTKHAPPSDLLDRVRASNALAFAFWKRSQYKEAREALSIGGGRVISTFWEEYGFEGSEQVKHDVRKRWHEPLTSWFFRPPSEPVD